MSDPNHPRPTVPLAVGAAIVALAAALRFYRLGVRPVHFDEGVHAYYAWKFAVEGAFTYEPWRHGPLLYYLTAPLMRLIDESVVVGRAVVAAITLGMFPALYLLRRDLPRAALLFSATVLAIHPYVLRTARFYRNDALLATFCLLTIGFYAAYRRTPTRPLSIGIGATIGLSFAAKEAAFLVVPAILLPVVVVAHFDGRFTGREFRDLLARYAPPRHALAGVTACATVVLFLYSNWPPEVGAVDGFVDGLDYWLEAGDSGSGEVTYYFDRVIGGTPVLAVLAAIGSVGAVVRTDSSWLRWLFLSWGGIVTAVLSLIGDQSWYNLIMVFPPVAILAGCGAHDAFLALRQLSRRIAARAGSSGGIDVPVTVRALAPAVVALLLVTAGLGLPNLTADVDDLGEQEVEGITTANETDTRKQVFVYARERAAETDCAVLIGPNEFDWPGPWWLRTVEFGWIDEWNDDYGPAIVVNRGPVEALEDDSYRLARPGDGETYYVYVPEQGCSSG